MQGVTQPPSEHSALDHVGTYRRRLPVSLERMYENALDWEHLPHLHASSFASIDLVSAGAWGWHAWVIDSAGRRLELELRLDRDCRRWITRNLSGASAGAEIWTHVFEVSERVLDIVVDFFVPDVAADARWKVGQAYAAAYETLYDEDVRMMSQRQQALDRRITGMDAQSGKVNLGVESELQTPQPLEYAGRDLLIVRDVDGGLYAVPRYCPHQLAPLEGAEVEDGVLVCPWHGYRFELRTGRCLSGKHCHFHDMPPVGVVDGNVVVG